MKKIGGMIRDRVRILYLLFLWFWCTVQIRASRKSRIGSFHKIASAGFVAVVVAKIANKLSLGLSRKSGIIAIPQLTFPLNRYIQDI